MEESSNEAQQIGPAASSAPPPVVWPDLPLDIQLAIFQSVLGDGSLSRHDEPIRKAAATMRLVSSQWAALVSSTVRRLQVLLLLRSPEQRGSHPVESLTSSGRVQFLLSFDHLEHLTLHRVDDVTDKTFLEQLSRLPQLHTLSLSISNTERDEWQPMDSLAWLSSSSLLDVRLHVYPRTHGYSSKSSSIDVWPLLQLLPPSLRGLEIDIEIDVEGIRGGPESITADTSYPLSDTSHPLSATNITSLMLKGIQSDGERVVRVVATLPYLQKLHLVDLLLTDEGFETATKGLSCLRDLKLQRNISGGISFWNALARLTALECLDIEGQHGTTLNYMRIFNQLTAMTSLTRLCAGSSFSDTATSASAIDTASAIETVVGIPALKELKIAIRLNSEDTFSSALSGVQTGLTSLTLFGIRMTALRLEAVGYMWPRLCTMLLVLDSAHTADVLVGLHPLSTLKSLTICVDRGCDNYASLDYSRLLRMPVLPCLEYLDYEAIGYETRSDALERIVSNRFPCLLNVIIFSDFDDETYMYC